jgi:ribosomal protein L13
MMKKLRVYAGAEHPHQSQVNQASAEAGQEE